MSECVSIIIPVYNGEAYLSTCLDSVCTQTYCNIEIILIDDGSSDQSAEICDCYAQKDSRIVVIHQKNSGVSVARNVGLHAASGTFVCFVDCDDMLPQTAIENLIVAQKQTGADLISGNNSDMIGGEIKTSAVKKAMVISQWDVFKCINLVGMCPWGKLYKKEIIDQNNLHFPIGIHYGEDAIFVLDYCAKSKLAVVVEPVVYVYNMDNTTSANNKFMVRYNEYMEQCYSVYKQHVTSTPWQTYQKNDYLSERAQNHLGRIIGYYSYFYKKRLCTGREMVECLNQSFYFYAKEIPKEKLIATFGQVKCFCICNRLGIVFMWIAKLKNDT